MSTRESTRDYTDEDGQPMLCSDCGRPTFYDYVDDLYHHASDRRRGCYLIPAEDEPTDHDHPHLDLVGLSEIAHVAGVTRQAVSNWRNRELGFPAPVADLRGGPVFSLVAVREWLSTPRTVPRRGYTRRTGPVKAHTITRKPRLP